MMIIWKMKQDKIKFLLASGDWGTPSAEDPIGLFGPDECIGIDYELKYDLTEEQRTWKYFMYDAVPSKKWELCECAKFPESDSPRTSK